MIQTLQFILVPLLASIVLLSLTCYFGIHVLKREIIFIDIALAQIAVLGGAVTVYLEERFQIHELVLGNTDLSGMLAYIFSLLFCVGAALIFTYLKSPKIRIPIEAFIGIAYAFATTAAVIILDKGAGSDVHLHNMLAGVLLWTTLPEVLRLFIVFLVIGGFHFVFRKNFLQLTDFYLGKASPIRRQKLWDFLFFFTLGITIIESVRIAGVLTVFAFLILPASISVLFSTQWRNRIIIGLVTGIFAAIAGLYFSLSLDLTASPLIILALGILFLLSLIIRKLTLKSNETATIRK